MKNLHHYYLPQVLDFLEINNDVYTVMDFISGKSFEQLLKEGYKFPQEQVSKYMRQLCEAMAYLHEQNPPIMHGNIKPVNIMLTPEDNICLIDFNISGALSDGNMLTLGFTSGYAAPEQRESVLALKNKMMNQTGNYADDEVIVTQQLDNSDAETELLEEGNSRQRLTIDNSMLGMDLRADIYSLGATIYHLASDLRYDVQADKKQPIEEIMAGYSSGFCIIISKAMEENSAMRFADAGEMLCAVNNMHKYDKEYKSMLLKQQIGCVALILLVSMSAAVCIFGRKKMG